VARIDLGRELRDVLLDVRPAEEEGAVLGGPLERDAVDQRRDDLDGAGRAEAVRVAARPAE
jgi:hypothetical protein